MLPLHDGICLIEKIHTLFIEWGIEKKRKKKTCFPSLLKMLPIMIHLLRCWNVSCVGIEPLKARHDITKLDLTIILMYWHLFEHSTPVFYIVHDFSTLKVTHKIQVMGSL